MIKHMLKTEEFKLVIEPEIFEDCIDSPENTILHIFVENSGFMAQCDLDVDIKEFAKFTEDLLDLYNKLQGKAKIQEPFNMPKYIEFSVDNTFHIIVRGYLENSDNKFTFENTFDQTYLHDFANEIANTYTKYIRP